VIKLRNKFEQNRTIRGLVIWMI